MTSIQKNKFKPNVFAFNSSTKRQLSFLKKNIKQPDNSELQHFIEKKYQQLNLKHIEILKNYEKSKENNFQKFMSEKRFKINLDIFNDQPITMNKFDLTKEKKILNKLKYRKIINIKKKSLPEIKKKEKILEDAKKKEIKNIQSVNKKIKNVICWQKQSQRTISLSLLNNVNIGPGSYNISTNLLKKNKLKSSLKPISLKKIANVSKLDDQEFLKQPVPGPGYYEINNSLEKKKKNKKFEFFDSCVERFQDNDNISTNTLGPGYYFKNGVYFNPSKVFNNKKGKLGFYSFRERFKDLSQFSILPGPGQYDIKSKFTTVSPQESKNVIRNKNCLSLDKKKIKELQEENEDEIKSIKKICYLKKKNIPFLKKAPKEFILDVKKQENDSENNNSDNFRKVGAKKIMFPKKSTFFKPKENRKINNEEINLKSDELTNIFAELPTYNDAIKKSSYKNKIPFQSSSLRFKNEKNNINSKQTKIQIELKGEKKLT